MNHQQYFDRRVIAEQHGFLEWRLAPGGTAEIVEIEVSSEHRRTGVGRKLLERMLAELPDDVRVIYAFTRETNGIAADWYSAVGFRMQLLPGFYADGDGAIICWRRTK